MNLGCFVILAPAAKDTGGPRERNVGGLGGADMQILVSHGDVHWGSLLHYNQWDRMTGLLGSDGLHPQSPSNMQWPMGVARMTGVGEVMHGPLTKVDLAPASAECWLHLPGDQQSFGSKLITSVPQLRWEVSYSYWSWHLTWVFLSCFCAASTIIGGLQDERFIK